MFDVRCGFGRFEEQFAEIMRRAGDMIRFARASAVEEKEGHANFVTDVDEAVERYIKGALLDLLPESAFIGEEQENEPLTDNPTWIVDPLDGTTNFIRDYRFSAVSAALVCGKKPVLAAVYQPYAQELFLAKAGHGATLNGNAIHVTDHPLSRALVGFGTSPYHSALAKESLELALRFLQNAADLRRCGSAALDLAYVACARQDVFFELSLKPWDYAAGALLVIEAGGVFSLPQGSRFGESGAVLACNAASSADTRALWDSFFARSCKV